MCLDKYFELFTTWLLWAENKGFFLLFTSVLTNLFEDPNCYFWRGFLKQFLTSVINIFMSFEATRDFKVWQPAENMPGKKKTTLFSIGKSERFSTVTSIKSRLYSVLFNLADVSVSLWTLTIVYALTFVSKKSVMLGLPLVLGKSTLCIWPRSILYMTFWETLWLA